MVGGEEFAIQTAGGLVRSTVFDGGKSVRVEMGKVSFWSDKIPVAGPKREVLNEKISVGGREFTFCAATIGNPHCVVVAATPSSPTDAKRARSARHLKSARTWRGNSARCWRRTRIFQTARTSSS